MTPEEANALTLGQRVRITGTLVRFTDQDGDNVNRAVRQWVRRPYLPWTPGRPKHLDGIVVGLRTLNNGVIESAWGDVEFTRKGSQQAVMVAWHPRRKIVHVAPEDVEVLDPEPDPTCDHTYPPENQDGTCPSCGLVRAVRRPEEGLFR